MTHGVGVFWEGRIVGWRSGQGQGRLLDNLTCIANLVSL